MPPARRGEYLAKAGTCFLCHAQIDADGRYVTDAFGAGGMRVELTHLGTVYARNVTGDPDTGIGRWTVGDLRRALRDGRAPNGRVLSPLDMPWTVFAGLTERDVDSLHAFLTTLPAARNLVPPPEATSIGDGVFAKLVALIRGAHLAGRTMPGNAGRAPVEGETIEPTTNPSADLWLVLAMSCWSHSGHGAVGSRSPCLGVVVIAVYTWPALRLMPPALVKAEPPFEALGRALALPPIRRPPPPRPAAADDTRVLAERGRYVAVAGTCTLCHNAGPSVTRLWEPFPEMGGGMRVTGSVFGTVYSRNLTPDPATGLGSWSDAQIVRAITTGLARDGRTMHWRAMPWDHFSHLSPEDLLALVTYLRHLPPVHSEVPAPAPDVPNGDGVWFSFGYSGSHRP